MAKDQITYVGSFGGSEKGEVSKRGQGAQVDETKAEKADAKKPKDEKPKA